MSAEAAPWTSLEQAGTVQPPASPLHLLPLMRPRKPTPAPLDRLPRDALTPRRAFTTSSSASSSTTWTSTVHVFPAAYPRSHFLGVNPPGPTQTPPHADLLQRPTDKQLERDLRAKDFSVGEEQLTLSSVESAFPPLDEAEAKRTVNTLLESGQPQLWSAIQRIVPERRRQTAGQGITLFLAHANGFHKEIWEPMLEALIKQYEQKDERQYIAEIWSLDTFNSGHAGVMNREQLSVVPPWFDHARDMLQFLQHYLPAADAAATLPTELKLTSRGAGRKSRTVIGLGHSHSGACMTMAATTTPGLLAGQIHVDPMMMSFDTLLGQPLPRDNVMMRGAIARKDVFASRRDAAQYMASKAYFATWDERVRSLHAQFGFAPMPGHRDDADPPVTLCMSKWSEAYQFAYSFLGCWAGLMLINAAASPATPTSWYHVIFSDYFRLTTDSPQAKALAKTRIDVQRAFAERKQDGRYTSQDEAVNHLVVQEDPNDCGRKVADVLHARIADFTSSTHATPSSRL